MAIGDPTRKRGASIPDLEANEWMALDLMQRPTQIVPVPALSASKGLVGGLGILAGAFFREAAVGTAGITYLTASAANAAAANNVTLAAGGAGVTTYVTGFEITGDGATAGSIIAVTLTGMIGGTKTYFITVPAGAGVAITPLIVTFPPPGLPASGANTAITLNVPSFGAGNTNAAASIEGYSTVLGTSSSQAGVPTVVTADLLDGLDALGEELAPIVLPAFGVYQQGLGPHGPVFTRGLFLSITTGTLRGAVYVKI